MGKYFIAVLLVGQVFVLKFQAPYEVEFAIARPAVSKYQPELSAEQEACWVMNPRITVKEILDLSAKGPFKCPNY
jgi:hypothetical protein